MEEPAWGEAASARRPVLSLYSVKKVWESSLSVCIHTKCSRLSMLKGNRSGHQQMLESVGIFPLEHLMLHQMATNSYDLPPGAPLAALRAPPVPMSMQTVRSAMLVREQLLRQGVSSSAHLSLEHMMRAEVGDARAMMALDPLSLPPDPLSVGYTLSKVLGALDRLVPGMPREMTPLDVPSLLGHAGRQMEDIAQRLPAPALLVGDAERNWIEVPPPALRWWEKLPLEPFGSEKNVIYCVICGSGSGPQASMMGHSGSPSGGGVSEPLNEVEARLFFRELSCMYEAARLGSHKQLDYRFIPVDDTQKARGGSAASPSASAYYKDAIIAVKPAKAPLPPAAGAAQRPPHASPSPFEDACRRALTGLAKIEEQIAAGGAGSVLPVLYILEPDFSHGNSWSLSPRAQQSPAKARAEWQRSLARMIASMAGSVPRVLDLVVQIVPAQRVNIGRKMQWQLRDLAMAVYSKARVRQRRHRPHADNPVIAVEDETHSFFSAAAMSIRQLKTRWERKLHEPLLTVPPPLVEAVEAAEVAAPPAVAAASAAAAGGQAELEPLVLHCCYAWSDDGLCLGAAVTDVTGEMLETFTALYPGSPHSTSEARAIGLDAGCEGAWRGMIQKLWNCLYEWMRLSDDTRPVRLVIGFMASGLDVARDISYWKTVLDKTKCGAGDTVCCEVIYVQLGVVRALQLLSWCPPPASLFHQPNTSLAVARAG